MVREEFEKLIEIQTVYGQGDSPTYSTMYLYKEMEKQMKQARGHVIRRHSKHGEVPDHMELSRKFKEYSFDWFKYEH